MTASESESDSADGRAVSNVTTGTARKGPRGRSTGCESGARNRESERSDAHGKGCFRGGKRSVLECGGDSMFVVSMSVGNLLPALDSPPVHSISVFRTHLFQQVE